MAKTGRNDPCPCGSGNKYKRCCLAKEEAAAAAAREAERLVRTIAPDLEPGQDVFLKEAVELTEASNAAVDLVHAGKLDEAEQAAHDLLKRFPYVHDGYDRLGMVYEARGEKKKAADCYRKVIAFIEDHPDDYDAAFADRFRRLVERLDPSHAP